ncbi:MAG TPA: S1 RNA-binding domain-containing protein, partial [Terriglobales bacterium]|nr:S1 RNA-binding domain-containing protein [Terriglobales bacterium]
MTLFEDSNSTYSDSTTSTLTEQQPAPDTHNEQVTTAEAPKAAPVDDFASALESFTTEAEELEGEDHVLRGTLVKLTPTHAVVDIGAKSEGMLPIAEVVDHEGKPKFQPGDEIYVVRDKGETEEGYINLSYQKAQKLRAWDEIEKAYSENQPIKATVTERT